MTAQQTRSHTIDMSSVLREQGQSQAPNEPCLKVENLNLFYGKKQALHNVSMQMYRKKVTAKTDRRELSVPIGR